MNLLKNLMILAVLGAVGYVVYLSLSPNNTESGSSPDIPAVDLSSAKPSLIAGGPLPLNAGLGAAPGTSNLGPNAPPPLAGGPSSSPTIGTPVAPVTPYPASGSSTLAMQNPLPPLPAANSPTSGSLLLPDSRPSAGPPSGDATAIAVAPPANQVPSPAGVRNLGPPPEVVTAGATVPAPGKATDDLLQRQFADVMDGVRKKLDEGKLAEAQEALSILYVNPNLPADQAKQVTEMLDRLAGTVVYSRQNYLTPPYIVQPGDTIDRIAQKCKVPWQLLARINGLMPPGAPNSDETVKDQPLPVGKELKVIEGPFDAIVQLEKRQLTLMVHNLYAGRFSIGIGRDQPKLEGQYTVGDKKLNPTYYGPDGITINPNDSKNPLGGAWIGLTDRIGIHGAPDPQSVGRDDNRGTICVGDRDLRDLYGILSVGSRVTIMR